MHQLAAERGGLIDLDAIPADVLRSELADYIQDLLTNAPAYAERRRLPARRKIARQVAYALTEPQRERGGEFLAGALYTNWLLTRSDNTDEDAAQRIPRTVFDILELDLATQANNPWLRAVLVTLAYAHGAGMPATVIRRIAPLFLPDNADISARLDVAEFVWSSARSASTCAPVPISMALRFTGCFTRASLITYMLKMLILVPWWITFSLRRPWAETERVDGILQNPTFEDMPSSTQQMPVDLTNCFTPNR